MGNDHDTPQTPEAAAARPEAARRREPPTIELAATEVTRDADAPPESGPESPSQPEHAAQPAPGRPGLTGALSGAATGAATAGAVLAAAWLVGWPMTAPKPPPPVAAETGAINALATRLSTLEADFRTAAALPQTAGSADLAPRIEAAERAQSALRDALAAGQAETGRLAAALEELKSELAALKAAPPATAAAPDLSAIEARIAEVAETARRAAASADAAGKTGQRAMADDRPLRRAVVATQLESAAQSGEPYAALLATAKGFETGVGALTPLDVFAASGVPRPDALGAELTALLPPPPRKSPAAADGFLDRLQASAARLVRIRREGPADGPGREAVTARAAAAARAGDLDTARRELTALPAAERGAFAAWIAKVEARDAALAAARAYAAAASAALARPAP